jgi:hypothetical protein
LKKAYFLIREQPHYRSDAFIKGLQRHGYKVVRTEPHAANIDETDLLVIWNLYGSGLAQSEIFKRKGARVLVCENGYIGKDSQDRQYYAIALNGHNGSGQWFVGGPERWEKLNIEIKPWRKNENGHLLVCAQRGIGSPSMASPPDWHNKIALELRHKTGRQIKIRNHPAFKTNPPGPLEKDFENCYAVVIWSSTTGVKALIEGIPVIYTAPTCIIAGAAVKGIDGHDYIRDRLPALQKMAWAQWSIEEIEMGLPFDYLLNEDTSILSTAA